MKISRLQFPPLYHIFQPNFRLTLSTNLINENKQFLLIPGECKSKTLPRIHYNTALSAKYITHEGKLFSYHLAREIETHAL